MLNTASLPVNRQGVPVRTETRADFEAHDPDARTRGNETRFLCPFPTCAGHQNPRTHRTLCYNEQTGFWHCHRCDARGQDPAKWKPQAASSGFVSHRERDRQKMRRFFAVPDAIVAPPPSEATPLPEDWRTCLGTLGPLAHTPGAAYLEGRGLPADFCARAGVKFAPDYYADKATGKPGRAAVVFPLRGENGRSVAAQGRHLAPDVKPKALTTRGGTNGGLFVTPGALDAPVLVIVEAPIDALTLAFCGLPAVATCGASNFPDRLKHHALGRVVVLAHDSDPAGDKATATITARLALAAPRLVVRLRPDRAKDWNDVLMRDGREALAASLSAFLRARVARFLPTPQPSPAAFDDELIALAREVDEELSQRETGDETGER